MSSGARCEEALPGTALGGIAMSILTFYYGKRKAKFSKKVGSYQKLQNIAWAVRALALSKWGAGFRQPERFLKARNVTFLKRCPTGRFRIMYSPSRTEPPAYRDVGK